MVTWSGTGIDDSYDLYQQIYTAVGVKFGGESIVSTTTDGSQYAPSVTTLASGGWVVTWQGMGPVTATASSSRFYTAAGLKSGGVKLSSTPPSMGLYPYQALWRSPAGLGRHVARVRCR